jgi:hypothetical protein
LGWPEVSLHGRRFEAGKAHGDVGQLFAASPLSLTSAQYALVHQRAFSEPPMKGIGGMKM